MGPWELVGAIADITEDQRGFITAAQTRTLGIDGAVLAGMVKARVLNPVRVDVWRIRGFDDMETYDDVYAWWLALRPELPAAARTPENSPVLSHFGAAHIYGYFSPGIASNICLVAPGITLSSAQTEGRCMEYQIPESSVVSWKTALVTDPERTALDLVHAGIDLETFGKVLEKMLQTGLTSPETIAQEIDIWAKQNDMGSGSDFVGAALLATKPGNRW